MSFFHSAICNEKVHFMGSARLFTFLWHSVFTLFCRKGNRENIAGFLPGLWSSFPWKLVFYSRIAWARFKNVKTKRVKSFCSLLEYPIVLQYQEKNMPKFIHEKFSTKIVGI
jgi:hypothetical protein